MNYIPKKYWQERGKNYSVSADTSKELLSLKYLLKVFGKKNDNILEIGSGYGRIYNYLNESQDFEIPFYTMCDFVKSMRDECENQTGIRPDPWDGKTLPYYGDIFDWVISFSVMLHVPPSVFYNHFRETVRVSRKYIYIATYYGPNKNLSKHCFRHNYDSLIEEFKLDIVYKRLFMEGKRINWLLRKF